jgi:hypothetical protein
VKLIPTEEQEYFIRNGGHSKIVSKRHYQLVNTTTDALKTRELFEKYMK